MQHKAEETAISTRKEIFDYLRNVQKETEIRARLSGINIWVLYGAIAFVLWTLLDPKSPLLSAKILHWALFSCQVLVFLIILLATSSVQPREDDIRFRPAWMASKTPLSRHWCMRYFWFAIPFLISGFVTGFAPHSIIVPTIMCFLIIAELFISTDNDDVTMLFGRTRKMKSVALSLYLGLLVAAIVENSNLLMDSSNVLDRTEIKTMVSLVAVYYLIMLLIQRGVADNSDAWTYELEKKLLLGLCSTEEALSAIESHSLGARLLTVVEKKRFNVTSSVAEVQDLLIRATEKIVEIESISADYVHERRAQFSQLSGPLEQAIVKYQTSVNQIDEFTQKLSARNKTVKDKRIEKLIVDLSRDIAHFKAQLSLFRSEMSGFERTLFGSERHGKISVRNG